MANPVMLEQTREVARFDPGRLEQLCIEKGEAQAETEAEEAISLIAALLREIETAPGNDRNLARMLRRLSQAADKIGMSTLARVAEDVRGCLEVRDYAAFAATSARLARVGDRSIHAIFDLDDHVV